jgi:hypothetical protein
VFVVLSVDEGVSLHEKLGSWLRGVLDTGEILYYVWVIPALAVTAVIALASVPLLVSVGRRIRIEMLVAGGVFVFAAAGLELIAGPEADAKSTDTALSVGFIAVEELLEMLALALFVHALLGCLVGSRTVVTVTAPGVASSEPGHSAGGGQS